MRRGSVACGHENTATAAIEILRAGGNAVDAVIAAFFAACVNEPVLTSPGGGGFAMLKFGGGSPKVLDFFTQTPRQKKPLDQLDIETITVDFSGVGSG